jgi:hypothetical protein
MDDEKKPAPSSEDTPKVYNRPAPVKTESDEDKSAMDAASAMASGSASSYGSQAAQDAPKGIKGGEHVVTEVKKEAPKRVAPKSVTPKSVTPKAAPKKAAPSPRKAGNDPEPYIRREEQTEPQIGNKKSTASTPRTGRTYNPQRAAASAANDFEMLKSLGRRLLTTSSGHNVSGFAKGGGVEAKGKTKGKVVKMAKGGMARGYGISKVTNKTKYC